MPSEKSLSRMRTFVEKYLEKTGTSLPPSCRRHRGRDQWTRVEPLRAGVAALPLQVLSRQEGGGGAKPGVDLRLRRHEAGRWGIAPEHLPRYNIYCIENG